MKYVGWFPPPPNESIDKLIFATLNFDVFKVMEREIRKRTRNSMSSRKTRFTKRSPSFRIEFKGG